jgi:hypothetical protein
VDSSANLDSSVGLDAIAHPDTGAALDSAAGSDSGAGSDSVDDSRADGSDADSSRATDAGDAQGKSDAGLRDATVGDAVSADVVVAEVGSPDVYSDAAGDAGSPSWHCVNWADKGDNFQSGPLYLSGMAAGDSYASVVALSQSILSEFQTVLGANSIRIPINEPTANTSWWDSYKGVIDTAIAKNMKVMVGYWAVSGGKPADDTTYYSMWQVVVSAYATSSLVYFDIHNEPYGFSSSAWLTFAESWLAKFPSVPKDHILIAGTGYDENVNPVGADSKLAGTLLNLHAYTMFSSGTTTIPGWTSYMTTDVGSYASRTVVSEWGAPMTSGTNYDVAASGDLYISYMNGVPNFIHTNNMGSCYWPGWRLGDPWSVTTASGTAPNYTLSVTNTSGLDRIHWAWGI